jgi:cyclopropane fatty-acyl-phospholipid synthase-like methyltransferase
MDPWKYYDITHKLHHLCNPLNTEKFERLCQLLRLKRGERVLDVACGKGEFLIRLAELYGIMGILHSRLHGKASEASTRLGY